MKYCVFCGSFNPINNIDLDMAKFILDKFDYEHVIFVPAYRLPKQSINEKQALHRYDMVKLAIGGEKHFSISNVEYRNEKNSYPYNVICELYKIFPNVEGKMGFIIASSEFENIRLWYKAEELKKKVDFLIYQNEDDFNPNKKRYTYLKENGYNYQIIDMPSENLSYANVKRNIKNGSVVENLIPDTVKEYMEKYNLL